MLLFDSAQFINMIMQSDHIKAFLKQWQSAFEHQENYIFYIFKKNFPRAGGRLPGTLRI
jgi:hypothetical protein